VRQIQVDLRRAQNTDLDRAMIELVAGLFGQVVNEVPSSNATDSELLPMGKYLRCNHDNDDIDHRSE